MKVPPATVLVVDDDLGNQTTVEAALHREGYRLQFAYDGEEGLAAISTLRPDAVILDVMMPKLDGYTVCERLRADPQLRHLPILMVTALNDQSSLLRGLAAGADDFITKPFSGDELRLRVRNIIRLDRFRLIEQQRQQLSDLFALAPGGLLAVDLEDHVLAANAEMDVLFGKKISAPGALLEKLLPRPALQALHGLRDSLELLPAAEKRGTLSIAIGRRRKHLEVRARRMRWSGISACLYVFADVTPQEEARLALASANRLLERRVARRTQALQEANALLASYAAFVAHDLRSHLSLAKGHLSLYLAETKEAAPGLRRAYSATEQLEQAIEDMLELALHAGQRHRDTPPPINPRPVLLRTAQRLEEQWPHLATSLQISALPSVPASSALLERVFYNLISNAAKYTSSRPQPLIEISGHARGKRTVLVIRDNGIGFSERERHRLFREYHRLPSARHYSGLGLGLALVRSLLRSHGGDITARPAATGGAEFSVLFPPGSSPAPPG